MTDGTLKGTETVTFEFVVLVSANEGLFYDSTDLKTDCVRSTRTQQSTGFHPDETFQRVAKNLLVA